MRIIVAGLLGLALAAPLAIGARPAAAQDQGNGFFGQVQRLFNNNNNNDQNAYERGVEQGRRQQAERDWHTRHGQPYARDRNDRNRDWGYNGPRYPDSGYRGYPDQNGYAYQSPPTGDYGPGR